MALNTFPAGVNTNATSHLNANFDVIKIISIDETTDLNFSGSNSGGGYTGTSSANKTYNISAADIGSADYLEIEIIGKFEIASNGQTPTMNVKIENTSRGTTPCDKAILSAIYSTDTNVINTTYFKYIYTLVAADKSGGCNVKITISGTDTDDYTVHSYTNSQVIFSKRV